jgi:hypothetical protein
VIEPDDQDWTTRDPVTQFGDIWRVGDHIIACGNALSPDEVLGDVFDGLELAKACITDPPYNVPTVGHIERHKNTPNSLWRRVRWMIRILQSFYLVQ